METAKLVTSDTGQVVVLPAEFQFAGTEVYIKRVGHAIVLFDQDHPWRSLIDSLDQFSEDFMATREQPPLDDREGKKLSFNGASELGDRRGKKSAISKKKFRRSVNSIQRQIEIHYEKIANEQQKEFPDENLIHYWEKEILGLKSSLARAEKRLRRDMFPRQSSTFMLLGIPGVPRQAIAHPSILHNGSH